MPNTDWKSSFNRINTEEPWFTVSCPEVILIILDVKIGPDLLNARVQGRSITPNTVIMVNGNSLASGVFVLHGGRNNESTFADKRDTTFCRTGNVVDDC